MTFVLSLLMAIYIIVPIRITGYVFGVFLCKLGPMRIGDLRKLLGLFFPIVLISILIRQTIDKSLHHLTDNFFSLSGHYIISDAIFLVYLLILLILLILNQPWNSRYFLPRWAFYLHDIQNAQRKEAEHNDNSRGNREKSKAFCCNTSL
ncbi:hypothetical protein Salpa_2203 [Sporomusa sp. KB1]|jgi:hypothetical protein|nr:hypothetical protein Salpa_2203 [Sporomusa sp. KB1]